MNAKWMPATAVLKVILTWSDQGRRQWSLGSVVAVAWIAVGLILTLGSVPQWSTARGQSTSGPNSTTPKPVASKSSLVTVGPNEIPLLKSLQERQARLEALKKREQELDTREEGLRAIQKQIEEKLVTLRMLRKEIAELLEEKDAFEENRYKHLVRVYEGMKPSEAASLVERLQEHTAIQILTRMKSKKVSQILEAIEPDRAAKLSERLATIPRQNDRKKQK